MKHYLNPTMVAKSFVLAGALSLGVLAGGHFTQAAGPDKVKAEHTVQVNHAYSAAAHVEVKPAEVPAAPVVNVQAKVETKAAPEQNKERAAKSQASVHASETAKLHAAPNSAVLGKGQKTEEVAVPETQVQASAANEVANQETAGTTDTKTDLESNETANLETDVPATTENADKEVKEEADHDSDSAVKTEDPSKDNDSAIIGVDTVTAVQANEDEDEESTEEDADKVNPSAENKAKSQASAHASENAKMHAAANSAVLAGQKVSEDVVTDEAAEETTPAVTDEAAEETTPAVSDETTEAVTDGAAVVSPAVANKANSQASENANDNAKEHAAANSAILADQVVSEDAVTPEVTVETATKE